MNIESWTVHSNWTAAAEDNSSLVGIGGVGWIEGVEGLGSSFVLPVARD